MKAAHTSINVLRRGPRTRGQTAVLRLMAATLGVAALSTISSSGSAHAVADDDWLGVVNTYRAMSGLGPVGNNDTWSAQGQAHSCYMLQNGIAHDEIPGRPGYTSGGDAAGNSGNVAVSSSPSTTPRNHIDLWMTGPFHAIGILRHSLRTSGFGLCAANSAPTPWRSGATLDVIRGIDGGAPRPSTPIVFPGNGATVPLHSFITEFPNPMTMCGWSGNAGLPLIAMMPNDVNAANATLTGPNGPIETCVLHKGNVSDSIAGAILDGDNAVIVMPRATLDNGSYAVTVNTDSGSVAWSFTVDRAAPLAGTPQPAPKAVETAPTASPATFEPISPVRIVDSRIGQGSMRLRAGDTVRLQVTNDPSVVAVSANFVAVNPNSYGFLTTYNCTNTLPDVSTLGYGPGDVLANQAFVPLSSGAMCLYSKADADVVIDINGYYRTSGASGFVPTEPARLYDTRGGAGRIVPGEERTIAVAGVSPGAPSGATAVALNLTAIQPESSGWVQVYPCGSPSGSDFSSINFRPGDARPNTVVTPVSDAGTICVRSSTPLDVAFDLSGYFTLGGGYSFQPLSPVRMFDSRLPESSLNRATGGQRVHAGQIVRLSIAGKQGVPAGAKAVSINITAVDAQAPAYLTAFPCGTLPGVSNVNIVPSQAVAANGAMVKLSTAGELCIYSLADLHFVVDINGVWS